MVPSKQRFCLNPTYLHFAHISLLLIHMFLLHKPSFHKMATCRAIFFISILFIVVNETAYGRSIKTISTSSVSDGVSHDHDVGVTSTVTCEPMYGFLPCTGNVWGQIFLIVVYQYLLYLGENYVSASSELIFRILGPGIFGASAFHILGAFPEALLVLIPGVSGSKETAQAQVVAGVGVLIGSSVFLLTLVWGTCVAVGKYDLSTSLSDDNSLSTLVGEGVTTDAETNYTAMIMVLSMIPFIIAQLPHMLGSSAPGGVATLIALTVTLVMLFFYCFYQVFQPWIQDKRLEFLMHKYTKDVLLQRLLTIDGEPNVPVMTDLFNKADQNNDKFITLPELQGLMLGIQFEEVGLTEEDFVEKVMEEFDTSHDAHIDENEFIRGISKWLSETKRASDKKRRHRWHLLRNSSSQEIGEGEPLLDQGVKHAQNVKFPLSMYFKAISLLLLGTFLLAILATPLIQTVVDLSTAANIPSIFISFLIVPLVVNYREASSAIASIHKKKQQSASLTFSEIYSSVFMNNIVGLAIFLGIVYARGLVWDFSAEVLVVLLVGITMGLYTSFRRTFPFWTSFVAYSLYPIAFLLLYVFSYVFGWA